MDISAAGMSEDGLSPLEETLASYMQVSHLVIHFRVIFSATIFKAHGTSMEIVAENQD